MKICAIYSLMNMFNVLLHMTDSALPKDLRASRNEDVNDAKVQPCQLFITLNHYLQCSHTSNQEDILTEMHLVIKHNTTKIEAEPDGDDSLQSDSFNSATKTHLHCQHSAASAHRQH